MSFLFFGALSVVLFLQSHSLAALISHIKSVLPSSHSLKTRHLLQVIMAAPNRVSWQDKLQGESELTFSQYHCALIFELWD